LGGKWFDEVWEEGIILGGVSVKFRHGLTQDLHRFDIIWKMRLNGVAELV